MFCYAKYQDYTVMDRQSRYKILFPLMYDDGTPITLPEHDDRDHVFGSHCDTSSRSMMDAWVVDSDARSETKPITIVK